MQHFTVSQTARLLTRSTGETVSPQTVSDLFYKRYRDDDRCPIVGRCRLIPDDYLPTIERVLRQRGCLGQGQEVHDAG